MSQDELSIHNHKGSLARFTAKADDTPCTELSFAEELLWQTETDGPAAVPFFDCARDLWLVLRLHGLLDQEALRASLDEVVQRHHVLRSRFVARNGQPVRLISRPPFFSFATIDRQGLPPGDPHEIVENEIRPQLESQVDLSLGPLLRAALMTLGRDDHILAVAVHHIVFDRWSKRLLQSELSRFYCARLAGTAPGVRPLPVQYQDYVLRQREHLNSERARNLREYWTNKLCGLSGLVLPCDGACGRAASTRSGASW